MKVCSFLPGATDMIYQLGLEHQLYGVTFECPSGKPKVVRSYLEGQSYTSEQIDNIVKEHMREGKYLFYIDYDLLRSIAPDVIFTQHVCNVCQIGTSYVEKAVYLLGLEPKIVPLAPKSLNDVYDNAMTIAEVMGDREAGVRLLKRIEERTNRLMDKLRAHRAPLRRVLFLEWMEPLYNCGHWIPYQIAQAGGVDMLSNPSGHSERLPWEKVLNYDPEIIVIAPCGLSVDKAREELQFLARRPGWEKLQSVRNGEVYIVDPNLFTCPSTSLIEGTELLASLFHPGVFKLSEQAAAKVFRAVF